MTLKFVTFTTHDGKSSVKINPGQVTYLASQEKDFTKIHFGAEQMVDVMGDLEAVELSLCSP